MGSGVYTTFRGGSRNIIRFFHPLSFQDGKIRAAANGTPEGLWFYALICSLRLFERWRALVLAMWVSGNHYPLRQIKVCLFLSIRKEYAKDANARCSLATRALRATASGGCRLGSVWGAEPFPGPVSPCCSGL